MEKLNDFLIKYFGIILISIIIVICIISIRSLIGSITVEREICEATYQDIHEGKWGTGGGWLEEMDRQGKKLEDCASTITLEEFYDKYKGTKQDLNAQTENSKISRRQTRDDLRELKGFLGIYTFRDELTQDKDLIEFIEK